MLSCESFLKHLKQSVEERTSLSADVRQHPVDCCSEECRASLLEYDLLSVVIPVWKESLPEIDMAQRVVDQVATASQPTTSALEKLSSSAGNRNAERSRRGSPMAAVLTVVGALSLCLLGLLQTIPSSEGKNGLAAVQHIEKDSKPTMTETPQVAVVQTTTSPVDTEVEAELRKFGKAYGSWVQDATNRLTDTVTVVLLDEQSSSETSDGWFSEITEQIEQPFESTLKFLIEETSTDEDEQTFFLGPFQNEYFGFRWSKSESLKPLFTLMFV